MKRFLMFIFVGIAALFLVACGEKEFAVDGEFVAFEVSHNRDIPMITWATVTVDGGKVVDIDIDAKQGSVTEGVFAWNAKSKKELGYGYRMHGPAIADDEEYKAMLKEEGLLEWFEQAELIEAHFLADLNAELTLDENQSIDNVTNVTIKDGDYSKVIKAALENARNNKFIAFELTLSRGAQVVWAEVTTNNKGKVTDIYLDTLQSTNNTWNAKSKKELGYGYRMHGPAIADDEEYKAMLKKEGLLEWFEQAELIEAFYLENINGSLDSLTDVTITTDSYTSVIKGAVANIK